MKKRLWLVTREVYATTIEKAIHSKGRVYDCCEAKDSKEEEKKAVGFQTKKK